MAFKRSAVRSRLSPPTTDRKANALRSCSIYGSDAPPRFPQQLNQVHIWRPFSIRRWALLVPSRFMRKIVCRLRLSEVSRQ